MAHFFLLGPQVIEGVFCWRNFAGNLFENFDPGEFFKCDCKVCDLTKEGGIVIFDDSAYEDEEILLD